MSKFAPGSFARVIDTDGGPWPAGPKDVYLNVGDTIEIVEDLYEFDRRSGIVSYRAPGRRTYHVDGVERIYARLLEPFEPTPDDATLTRLVAAVLLGDA